MSDAGPFEAVRRGSAGPRTLRTVPLPAPRRAASGAAVGDRWRSVRSQAPLVLAVLLPIVAFLVEGDIGLSLLDEGFHWYGAQRVLAGDVPLRDFQSYDIGRHYWSAFWMLLAGDDGIRALRAGNAVMAACAVVIATLLVRSSGPATPRRAALSSLAALTFTLWMAPNYRVSDGFASLLLVGGLALLLARADRRRRWAAFGVCLGVAGVVGINHALYGVVGLALAIGYLGAVRRQAPSPGRLAALAAGATVGYAPVLAFHLLVPGFTAAFVDSIRLMVEAGTTNLTLPMPRLASLLHIDEKSAQQEFVLAAVFIAAPCFLLACGWRLLRDRDGDGSVGRHADGDGDGDTDSSRNGDRGSGHRHAAFAAAVLMAFPYAHYAWSRADFVHTGVSALPLLVAVWTCPLGYPSWLKPFGFTLIAAATAFYSVLFHPAQRLLRGQALERVTVHGEVLRLPHYDAEQLASLLRWTDLHAAGARSFYAAPYLPGAYAVTRKRSPTWESYALFRLSAPRQRREIERLADADIALALISTHRQDNRADLGFEQTHPLVAAAIRRCMREAPPLPGADSMTRAYIATTASDMRRCAAR